MRDGLQQGRDAVDRAALPPFRVRHSSLAWFASKSITDRERLAALRSAGQRVTGSRLWSWERCRRYEANEPHVACELRVMLGKVGGERQKPTAAGHHPPRARACGNLLRQLRVGEPGERF